MTLVSKNGLSFIDLFAVKFEIRREGPLHLTELLECPLFGPVTRQPSLIRTVRPITLQYWTKLTSAARTVAIERERKMALLRTLQKPSVNTPAETDPCFIGVFHTLNQRLAQLYY